MRGLVFALLGQAALGACGIDASANPGARCDQVTSCPLPQTCYRGFCVNGHDVPALELDAALTPASMGGPGSPTTNATSLEAGAPAAPLNTSATSLEAGAQVVPATGAPVVPSAGSASDAGSPSTVAPAPGDAAASPPAQVSTPPAVVTTPPAQQPSTPPAQVAGPAPQPVVTPVEPVQTPAAPSMPVQTPPAMTPAMPPATDTPDNPPPGEQPGSPLLVCLPLCASRSVLCLVCLSGGLGSAADNCSERERRRNPSVREMCDFLCDSLGCQR